MAKQRTAWLGKAMQGEDIMTKSKSQRRSKEEKEMWALRAIFNAMYAVGVTATNDEEAEQAIDLAAKLLSYVLKRKVKTSEVRARIAVLAEEWMAEHDASVTKH